MAKSNDQAKQEVRGRRKKTSFSIVANPIIDDMAVSPTAGWLYVLIQRWVTFNAEDFVCSKSFLFTKYKGGKYMFDRAWDELKEAGYLKMYSHPTEGWEFELLDEAQPNTPHTYYLDLNGDVKSTNIDRAAKKAAKEAQEQENDHYPKNQGNGYHYPKNHSNGNHSNGNHSNGNQGNIINTPSNNSFNNSVNEYQSINPTAGEPKKASEAENDRLIDGSLLEKIKNQIDYEACIKARPFEREMVDLIVNSLAQLYVANKPMVFSDISYDPQVIHDRAAAFNNDHVGYVIDSFNGQPGEIRNVPRYILVSVFNAPVTFQVLEDRAYIGFMVANSNQAENVEPPKVAVGQRTPGDWMNW